MDSGKWQLAIERALAGDPAAAERLVYALMPIIQRTVAYNLLLWRRGAAAGRNVRQEVQDLTQDTLLQLFAEDGKVLRSWQEEKGLALEGFVRLIARRQVAAKMRHLKHNFWQEDPTLPEDLDQASEACTPETDAASREELTLLLARLKKELSPLGWHLFDLLYLRELSIAEIVEQTGMSSMAVYQWRCRLRQRLQQWRLELSEPGEAA